MRGEGKKIFSPQINLPPLSSPVPLQAVKLRKIHQNGGAREDGVTTHFSGAVYRQTDSLSGSKKCLYNNLIQFDFFHLSPLFTSVPAVFRWKGLFSYLLYVRTLTGILVCTYILAFITCLRDFIEFTKHFSNNTVLKDGS